MMPVLLAVLLILAATLGLMGCTQPVKPRIALCMSHMSNDFTNVLASAARTRADELGIELIVLDAQQDTSRQAGQISTLLRDGIDGLVIEPTAVKGLDDVLKKAMDREVPVVLVTQRVDDASLFDCYVGTDAVESGRLEMTSCVESLAGQGDIAILRGPVGAQAAEGRYQGYQEILAANPQVRIVAELNADWNEMKAEAIVTNWLEAGKVMNAIVAQNDEMAIGTIKALQKTGHEGQIQVFGVDASSQAIGAIIQNNMQATVSQRTAVQGGRALEVCLGLSRGESFPSEILISQFVISHQNVNSSQN